MTPDPNWTEQAAQWIASNAGGIGATIIIGLAVRALYLDLKDGWEAWDTAPPERKR